MIDRKVNPDDRIEATWCTDSETGERLLIDHLTNKILARKENGKVIWEV